MDAERKPKRSLQACTRCRQQKMKCDGDGDSSCARCRRMGATCIFEPPWRPSSNRQASSCIGRTINVPSIHSSYGPSPPDSARSFKRRRLNMETLSTTSSPVGDIRNPYSTVLDLEDDGKGRTGARYQARSDIGDAGAAYDFPENIGMNIDEALEMFALFGQRIAPFIPTTLDADFTKLPASPLFILAAIYTVARYLPETMSLRVRCGNAIRELLEGILFERVEGKPVLFLRDTMHGLAILYCYCEANDRDESDTCTWRFDMLSMKGIIEGYAVKIGIAGMGSAIHHRDPIFSLYWLWMYTFSHYTATMHGCARTIWAAANIYHAKHVVETHYEHPRILTLLGEVELCLLWERLTFTTTFASNSVDQEMEAWDAKWSQFMADHSSTSGRQLRFHQGYAMYRLRSWLLATEHTAVESQRLKDDKAKAAHAFLGGIISLSPIVKDRLRYMCDYAFVAMAYVSVCVLRDAKSSCVNQERPDPTLINLVRDIAALMQSYGGVRGSRAAIYGMALYTICQSIDEASKETSSRLSTTSATMPIQNALRADSLSSVEQTFHTSTTSLNSVRSHESGDDEPLPHAIVQPGSSTSHPLDTFDAGTHAAYAFPYDNGNSDYLDVLNNLAGIMHVVPESNLSDLYPTFPNVTSYFNSYMQR